MYYRHKETGSIYTEGIIDIVLKQTNTTLGDYEEFDYKEPETEVFDMVIENKEQPLLPEELHRLKVESDLEYIKCLQELQVGL